MIKSGAHQGRFSGPGLPALEAQEDAGCIGEKALRMAGRQIRGSMDTDEFWHETAVEMWLWHEVAKRIQNPNEAGSFIGHWMERCKDRTFNGLITADFSNPASQIQDSVAAFCNACRKTFDLKAIYLEMNGFDINPDRWYFDFFGYDSIHEDDIDWLCNWQSAYYPGVTLTGLEATQALYASYMEKEFYVDKEKKENERLANLMVMAKFCKLIDESLDVDLLKVHVYATAHEFDIIFHKAPNAEHP